VQSERIAFEARQRGADEALDLGVIMARHWWWPLQKVWLLAAVPFALTLAVLPVGADWKLLLFWWFKPLYELAPLYLLSQRVFGERPSTGQCLGQWIRTALRYGPALLTLRRLDVARSFNTPVSVLESQSGKARRRRLRVLHLRGSGQAVWFTIICANAELVVALSLIALMRSLVPSEFVHGFLPALMQQRSLLYLVYGLGMALIAPFYVAGGFSLYLNRRIDLEAWDIDLVFRRLAGRIARIAPVLVLAVILGTLSRPSQAEAPRLSPAASRAEIGAVLAGAAFHHRVHHRRPTLVGFAHDAKRSGEQSAGYPQWLRQLVKGAAGVVRWILWALVLTLLVWCLVRVRRWLAAQSDPPDGDGAAGPAAIVPLADGTARADGDVLALLEQGRMRASLALLYRQVLETLSGRYELQLEAGATEQDCLDRIAAVGEPEVQAFFCELTAAWQGLAYAHEEPERADIIRLHGRWQRLGGSEGETRG